MKSFILVILGIIVAVLLVGGVVGYNMVKNVEVDSVSDDSSVGNLVDKVSSVASSGSSDDLVSDASDIVSDVVKFNEQNGEGYYHEVTYSDGGFRQYDVDTGELIGSSYESDQDKLPSLE